MPCILLFGAGGQLGKAFLKAIPNCVAFDRQNGDICDFAKIARIVAENRPNVIINAAAFTAVDLAESEKEKAFAANFKAVQNLAEIAKKENSLLVHFSTDYVFDGEKASSYKENDPPNPQNVYGESKLAGESAILKSACDFLIFRTSWVFGDGGNFVKSILNLAQKNAELKIVADQVGCPTATRFLAEASQIAIAQVLKNKEKCGLYHLTQSRALSWFAFAEEIVAKAKSLDIPLKVKKIQAIKTEDFPRPAKRPKNSVLNCEKFSKTFGIKIPPFDEDLLNLLKNPRST